MLEVRRTLDLFREVYEIVLTNVLFFVAGSRADK